MIGNDKGQRLVSGVTLLGHQSLVMPIDWKLWPGYGDLVQEPIDLVTNHW